ncbi:MAG TPA: DNA polymerase III subunit gamma/tau [Saprospiraceae bacterium]|nr:DNA polymerase III subunit gamma/tau [Saprospiraceae bacterium]
MSKFVVSARKYRPTTFDEVIGQDHVAKTLKNALQTDHLAHAFLFTGPRGVGKTTCARILAKIINCEQPINKVEACNTCGSCTAFNENASFNILELDAASNNSVDNIRTLIEQVRFQPQQGKYKVFIIDEVHMLSTQAFNAFLKTLEEPPSYAIFILATTEKHKVLPTILSRCQIFDFKRIQIADAVTQLKKICEKEGLQADEEALHIIANKADGAMRDALSIFDKISSSTGNVITYKDVVANLNLLDYEYYFKITDAFLREDISEVLLTLNEIVKQGFDAEHFLQGLADHFRDLMVAKIPATISILEVSDDLKKRYFHQAGLAKSSFLLSGLNILNQCDIDLIRAKNKRLNVELALSKLTFLNRALEVDIFSGTTQEKKTNVVSETPASTPKVEPSSVTKPVIAPAESSNTPQNIPTSQAQAVDSKPDLALVETPAPEVTIKPDFKKLSGIDAIRESIRQAEATKAEARKNLNIDQVNEIWRNYSEHNPSKSVQSALNLAKLSLEEKTISAIVPTQVSKDMIIQEVNLLDKLRDELGAHDLIFDITVDRSLFPDFEESKPIQAMTQRERYMVMLEKNPDLGSFTKKFGLKLDTEV